MSKNVRAGKLPQDTFIREIAKGKLEKMFANEEFIEAELDMQVEIHLPKIREDSNYVKMR